MYKRFCDICGKEITRDSDCAVVCTKIDRGAAALNGLARRNKKRLMALGGEMCEECYEKFCRIYKDFVERKGSVEVE